MEVNRFLQGKSKLKDIEACALKRSLIKDFVKRKVNGLITSWESRLYVESNGPDNQHGKAFIR